MRPFEYARPATLAEAVALLEAHGPEARLLAGGTDLVVRLRDGTARPSVVIDVKRIAELRPAIRQVGGRLVISAGTVMTDVAEDEQVRRHFPALVEAAEVVGSVQIRNRATLAGNICNASPAADTAPPLLVYGAEVVACGAVGRRRIRLDEFFVRSGETTLRQGELLTAIELPLPARRMGAAHVRRTRRRGHDLASVTLCCGVDEDGVTSLAYGSVGPRPILAVDESGTLADPAAPAAAKAVIFERMFAAASPSPRSMRASPDYRLAMLRVLGSRALASAIERLAGRERPR
jgi:CO/xanthine dehydrogenase FAD-binding subunit